MIRRIGDAVVDIVHLLKDLGIDKNTLIVFTSDWSATISLSV
jgi:arylsulfatase A-like enzyme